MIFYNSLPSNLKKIIRIIHGRRRQKCGESHFNAPPEAVDAGLIGAALPALMSCLNTNDHMSIRRLRFFLERFADEKFGPGSVGNNRDNIDYATYIQNGFFIGSGANESASRTVLQRRLKLPGTRWNIQSAQNMVASASKYRSCLWESEVVKTILITLILMKIYPVFSLCRASSEGRFNFR
ncbi:MAG: hypothetical protein LBO05_04685 [Deltaproteobacteria bacterium]|nr:hypothetical protein [Deltaproteobacteria bacterium]